MFLQTFRLFWKIEFLTENPQPRTLQKWWKFCTISKCPQNVLRKYFSAKLFVPLIKRSVSTIFKAVFGKLNFWQKIHSRGPYKNGENFVLSQNVLRKYFFAKFFVFGKLNFWRKIHSRGPYKNGENFVLSQNVLRKYFLATFFVSPSKEVFLQFLRQFLENWIFDGKSTAADLTKMVKILYYLKMC